MQMKLSNKNKLVLFDIDYTLFDTANFKDSSLSDYQLYDEIEHLLIKLSSIVDLGIFSKGEKDFQKLKLQKTGIEKYFHPENIHIFENKDENLQAVIKKYSDRSIYLVDDKLEILYNTKKNNSSIFTIWIKRGPYAQDETLLNNFSPDKIVESLNEMEKYILDN
jgi:phosphoglycolate phosphatase-like HAD superfamily hydrolase